MRECSCGNDLLIDDMCPKCGNVYNNRGVLSISDTNDRILEFIVYHSSIESFDGWRDRYICAKKTNQEFLILNEFRQSIQAFLIGFNEDDLIDRRKDLLNKKEYINIPESMLISLGFI